MTPERLRQIADWIEMDTQVHPLPGEARLLRQHADELEARSFQEKIFSHKHLDPKCVDSGCQSVALEQAQKRIAELEAALRDAVVQMQVVARMVPKSSSGQACSRSAERAAAALKERP